MATLSDWMTTQEAAEFSGYHVQHIRRLARSGRIEARKWGRDWIVNQESLLSYIKHEGHGPEPKRIPPKNML